MRSLGGILFESLIDLKYLSEAPVQRPRRFIEFEQVEKYFNVQKVLRRKRLPKGVRKQYSHYKDHLQGTVKPLLKKFSDKRFERFGWSGKSIRTRAKSVGLDLDYDRFYSIVCAYKQSSPSAASGAMLNHEDGVDVILGPNLAGVYDAAVHSARLFLDLCAVFQGIYGLELEPELEQAGTRLRAALNPRR
jgi:hypothetical protein